MRKSDQDVGDRAATIKDVARLAGVSPITVSRVVNGEPNVLPDTRAAVQAAVKTLSYAPNRAAQLLVGAQALRIGLLLGNPSSSFLGALLAGSLDEANRVNAHLTVGQLHKGVDAAQAVRRLLEGGALGLIVPAPNCDDGAVLDVIHEFGRPAVAVATSRPPEGMSAVSIDEYRAALEMTRFIIELGHRRIGFITGFAHPVTERRLAGYRDALAQSGIPFDDALIGQGLYTYHSGLEAAGRLLDLRFAPTAIFASNDDMAAAAVAVAHRRGIAIPDELTVCGFDDSSLATNIWPELTTVHQPIPEMSHSAVAILADQIRAERRGETVSTKHLLLDFRIVHRSSAAKPHATATTSIQKMHG